MKKLLLVFLLTFFACGPSEDEIQAQVDLAVENALIEATSSTTSTLAPATSTTKPKNNTSSNQSSKCTLWVNSTRNNLIKYESISNAISNDSYDAAYGYISLYAYQNNLESYESRLISMESSQKQLSPNSENITSHNHLLDAISASITAVSFTIVGLEVDDPSYIELAADLTLLANDSIKESTRTLKNC